MNDDSNRLGAGNAETIAKWNEVEFLPSSKNQHPRQADAVESHDAAQGDFQESASGASAEAIAQRKIKISRF
jgi:hypothetical protein